MLKEILAGAKLEFSADPPAMFILVWYDKHGEVEFARRVSYEEMEELLDVIYPAEEIDAYINKTLNEAFIDMENWED